MPAGPLAEIQASYTNALQLFRWVIQDCSVGIALNAAGSVGGCDDQAPASRLPNNRGRLTRYVDAHDGRMWDCSQDEVVRQQMPVVPAQLTATRCNGFPC